MRVPSLVKLVPLLLAAIVAAVACADSGSAPDNAPAPRESPESPAGAAGDSNSPPSDAPAPEAATPTATDDSSSSPTDAPAPEAAAPTATEGAGTPPTEAPAPETATTATPVSCAVTPSQTEGPYYFDTGEFRRDITEGLPGTSLLVSLRFVEADSCEPVAGATVDIWHTDASGVYSGYPDQDDDTTGETFLRGKQVTDANGIAEFETIYPGWYPTRAVHIHFMAYTDEGHLVTSQLYFPDDVSEAVYQTEPYATRGPHPVTNAADGIFPGDTVGSSLIGQVTENGNGYMISLSVGVTPGSPPAADERFPVRRGGR